MVFAKAKWLQALPVFLKMSALVTTDTAGSSWAGFQRICWCHKRNYKHLSRRQNDQVWSSVADSFNDDLWFGCLFTLQHLNNNIYSKIFTARGQGSKLVWQITAINY